MPRVDLTTLPAAASGIPAAWQPDAATASQRGPTVQAMPPPHYRCGPHFRRFALSAIRDAGKIGPHLHLLLIGEPFTPPPAGLESIQEVHYEYEAELFCTTQVLREVLTFCQGLLAANEQQGGV